MLQLSQNPPDRGFLGNLANAFTKPIRRAFESARYASSDPGTYTPMFESSTPQDIQSAIENPNENILKTIATVGSFAVPGAPGIKGGALTGASAGALGGYGTSEKDDELNDILMGGLTGGAIGGAVGGVSKLLSKRASILPDDFRSKAINWADDAEAAVQRQAVGGPAPKKVGGALLEKESSKVAKEFGKTINTVDDLQNFSDELYAQYGGKIAQATDDLAQQGVTVSLDDALAPLEKQLASTTQPEFRAPLEKAIANIREAFSGAGEIPINDFYKLKQGWGKLAKYRYGADPLESAVASAYDDAYRNANDILRSKFGGGAGKTYKTLHKPAEGGGLVGEPGKLGQIAKTFDTEEGFVAAVDDVIKKGEGDPFGKSTPGDKGVKLSKAEQELKDAFYDYTFNDDVYALYNEGLTDGEVLRRLHRNIKGVVQKGASPEKGVGGFSPKDFDEANKYLSLAKKQEEWVTNLAARDRIQLRMNDPFQDRIGIGAILGGSVGGFPGAAVGAGATYAANQTVSNPNVQRGAIGAIRGLAQKAPGLPSANIPARVAPLAGLFGSQMIEGAQGTQPVEQAPIDPIEALGTQPRVDPQQELAMLTLQLLGQTGDIGDASALAELLFTAKYGGSGLPGEQPKLTEKQRAYQEAGIQAEQALRLLEGGGIDIGPIAGRIENIQQKLSVGDSDDTEYRSLISGARTAIRNAMLGANMTPREMESLEAFIPEFTDSPEKAAIKLRKFVESANRYSSSSMGSPQDDLLQTLGGY